MPDSDPTEQSALVQPGDLWVAFGLLTRLPVPGAGDAARSAKAAWAWPLVGSVIGFLGLVAIWIGVALGTPTGVTAAAALAVMILATGALHEDGLADTADGFWGGSTIERRLEIMRDSRIGTYGVLALILSLLARWSLIGALIGLGAGSALIAAAVISRAPMVVMMARMRPARDDGLSHHTGQPPKQTAWLAAGVAALLALLLVGWSAIPALLAAYAVAAGLAVLARAKIGGQSGDVLGASQQLAEIAALAAIIVVIS